MRATMSRDGALRVEFHVTYRLTYLDLVQWLCTAMAGKYDVDELPTRLSKKGVEKIIRTMLASEGNTGNWDWSQDLLAEDVIAIEAWARKTAQRVFGAAFEVLS